MVITYNAIVALMNLVVLLLLSRHRSGRALTWGLLASAGTSILLTGLGFTAFDVASLTGWGAFLHGPLFLAGAAVLVRKTLPRSFIALSVCALLLAMTGLHAYHVEPYRLELTRLQISSPKIEQALRIAVLADIQTDRIGRHERRALRWTMAEKPDLILFLGDYVQEEDPERARRLAAELNRVFKDSGLHAPLGVHAVGGNTDVGQDWTRVFDGLPAQLHWQTRSQPVGPLQLTAISAWDSFDPHLRIAPSERFHVAFGHSPDFALGEVEADLLLAGHTHGGQVRLPFVGALITFSRIPRAWAAGLTRLPGDRNLIVSRGVGMERADAPQLRFLCRPEVLIVDLIPRALDD